MTDTITTELRAAMNVDREYTMGGDVVARTYCMGRDEFADLCDAIDAVHASLERENESLRRELDRVLGEQEGRDGWIELPKDMNGEYIHIGDEVETTNFGTVEVEGFVHRAVAFYNYSEQPAYLCTTPANLCRHHAPTVEDVLREFAVEVCGEPALTIRSGVVEEYASRLRLAGES